MGRVLFRLVKQTIREYSEDRVPQLAASLAYYTIFSLAPLLVIVVGIAGLLFDQNEARQALLGQMRGLVGQEGAEFLRSVMESANRERAGVLATVIGIGAMIFGATGAFVALHEALNRIWGAPTLPIHGVVDFIRKRFLSFTLVLGVGFLLLVSLVFNTGLAMLDEMMRQRMPGSELVMSVVNWLISFILITILFAMIYKILPDIHIRWRDVWVGAAATTLLFNLGKEAIGLYLGNSVVGSTYGAAGALALLLLWIYYSAQVLLIGAEFTQIYARWRGSPTLPEKPTAAAAQTAQENAGPEDTPQTETANRVTLGTRTPAMHEDRESQANS